MITRHGLADEIDGLELQIKVLNEMKSAAFKAYREQLEGAGMEPRRASAELAATKAAIGKRRQLRQNPDEAREKDDLIDAILFEIMDRPSRAHEAGDLGTTPKPSASKVSSAETADLVTSPEPVQKLHELPLHDKSTGELLDEQPEQKSDPVLSGGNSLPAHEIDESAADDEQEKSVSSAPGSAIEFEDSASDAGLASSTNSNSSEPNSSPVEADTPDAGANASGTLSEDEFVPLSFQIRKMDIRELRPHCLNPSNCGGSGSKHCHACLKAAAEGEAA